MATELTVAMEDYLEAIYGLEQSGQAVRVKDIAASLGVRMPSVTGALSALQQRGLARHERYGLVELTDEGRRVGRQVLRRHEALTSFLRDILDLPEEEALAEACELEHALSSNTLSRLLCLLDFIERCPRGGRDWLGHLRGRWSEVDCDHNCTECISEIKPPRDLPFALPGVTVTLDQCGPGFHGRVVKVGGRGAIKRRLVEMGMTPGAELEVRRVAPLGDPIEVIVRDYHLSLRKGEAALVLVEPHPSLVQAAAVPATEPAEKPAGRARRGRQG